MSSEPADYRAALRELVEREGKPVRIMEDRRARHPNTPAAWVSQFDWADSEAELHWRHGDCSMSIPPGVVLDEVSYVEWGGTFGEDSAEIGIQLYGGPEDSESEIRCACGKYRGMTLRWTGSLGAALRAALGTSQLNLEL